MQNKRISSLILIGFLATVGLTSRLFFISVIDHKKYEALAKNQQEVERVVLPKRGDIFVQDYTTGISTAVAKSVERYSISVTPKNVTKKAEYAEVLGKITETDPKSLLETFKKNGAYMSPLKHSLTLDDVQSIATEVNALEKRLNPKWNDVNMRFDNAQGQQIFFTGGIYFEREYQRVYPEGGLLAQVLGFVNDYGTGQYGIEGEYDKELKGYSGRLNLQLDSVGTLLGEKAAVQGKDGTEYELSIDRNVQFVAERELAQEIKDSEAKSGSVIIMDPKTGEIIAMASQPSYDPSKTREVKQDEISLFDNPAISHTWEPGSIFKPLVMSAALDQGLVRPETKETFEGSVIVNGYKIETALRKAYGLETMTQVLANSDNVAMVWVANKLGNQTMHGYLKKYGFGDFTNIDLKNEISGNLPPVKGWKDINRATISFGQGISVTPMQIVAAYAAVANDGKMVRPRIVHALIDKDGVKKELPTTTGEQVIKSQTAKELRDMMVSTVIEAHSRAGTPGYKIGGKTGTAQIPDPEKGGYLPDAYNHSFIGIGPSDNPRYVMLTKIDHPNLQKVGLYAEGTAVPLFGRISTFLLNYYQIPPTNK